MLYADWASSTPRTSSKLLSTGWIRDQPRRSLKIHPCFSSIPCLLSSRRSSPSKFLYRQYMRSAALRAFSPI